MTCKLSKLKDHYTRVVSALTRLYEYKRTTLCDLCSNLMPLPPAALLNLVAAFCFSLIPNRKAIISVNFNYIFNIYEQSELSR